EAALPATPGKNGWGRLVGTAAVPGVGSGAVIPSVPMRNAVAGPAPPVPRHWLPFTALAALTAPWQETACNRLGASNGVRMLMTPFMRPYVRPHPPRMTVLFWPKIELRMPLSNRGFQAAATRGLKPP